MSAADKELRRLKEEIRLLKMHKDEKEEKDHKEKEEKEYKDILERSIFSLCPRGSSPSAVRFWECLSAGTIPILMSDEWALPEWDWDNTILRVPEREVSNLDNSKLNALLSSLDHVAMREKCLLAYNKFKKQNFREYIQYHL